MAASFHLTTILSQSKLLLEKIERPVFLIIDNAHSIRFGRTLSETEKPLRKLLPKLSIIYTSTSADCQLACFPMAEDLISLKLLQGEQCLEVLKMETMALQSAGQENLNSLMQQVSSFILSRYYFLKKGRQNFIRILLFSRKLMEQILFLVEFKPERFLNLSQSTSITLMNTYRLLKNSTMVER